MLPSWIDPHISLDGIAAIITILLAGAAALRQMLTRFTGIENQSRANAHTLVEHGQKIDRIGDVMIRMEKSDGRVNMLEQVQIIQGKRLDEMFGLIMKKIAGISDLGSVGK